MVAAAGTVGPASEHRVPAHAAWFDYHHVADIERRSLPEFFDGRSAAKTPEAYMEARNRMVDAYRADVRRHLSFRECQGSGYRLQVALAGDVNGLRRVWGLLTHWGLINFQDDEATRAGQPSFLVTAGVEGEPDAVRLSAAAMAPSPEALFRFKRPTAAEAVQAATCGAPGSEGFVPRREGTGHMLTAAPSVEVRYRCSAMPWVDCTAVRYHCKALPKVDLCPRAFAEGRFPGGTSAKDFVRMLAPSEQAGETSDGWTDAESLLLLDGVQMYGERWNGVAAHVGTKNAVQCIIHFLQLAEEDPHLDALEAPDLGAGIALPLGDLVANGSRGYTAAEAAGPIPFAESGNPVMAQVAFLTSIVSPAVGAVAAQRALEVLSELDAEGGDAAAESASAAPTSAAEVPIPQAHMRIAAAAALSAAAAKARLLADAEERDIRRIVAEVVELQLQKLQKKLSHFEAMEIGLETERGHLEKERNALLVQRASFQEQKPVLQSAAAPIT